MPEDSVLYYLESALESLQERRTGERSEANRHTAIVITDLEKLIAVYEAYKNADKNEKPQQ